MSTKASVNHPAALLELKAMIMATLEDAPAYSRAPLYRELRNVLADLAAVDALKPKVVRDVVDDLATARARRQSKAAPRKSPAAGVKRRQGSG
jgi:hypothetical protein